MNPYTYQRKSHPKKKMAKSVAPGSAMSFIKHVANYNISPAIAFSFILFAAFSSVSLTFVLWAEAPTVYDSPVTAVNAVKSFAKAEGAVLGQTTKADLNKVEYLTVPGNKKLKLKIQASNFTDGKWSYNVFWSKPDGQGGSIYIRPSYDKNKNVYSLDSTQALEKYGSGNITTDAVFIPSTKYVLEFYSKADGKGKLLLRKYFTAEKSPVVEETPKENMVFCTQDAKICPDGTAVGRTGPKCEFAPCPSTTK